jgi:translation initiation factor IF-2
VPKFGTIAGLHGHRRDASQRSGDTQARLLRDNVVIHEGKIGSLRRFKDDVSEVKAGFECGIGFEKYNDIKVGDVIEGFRRGARRATV